MFKKLFWATPLLLCAVLLSSCDSSDDDTTYIGNWVKCSDFGGIARSHAVVFVANGKAYVVSGYNGKKRLNSSTEDSTWEYDPSNDSWTGVASFPGTGRTDAVAFAVGTKGYVGLGYDGEAYLKDFWEYNTVTNTWKQVKEFAGSARYGAFAFSLNDKGYVGAGYDDNYKNDLWQFDPTVGDSGTWSPKSNIPSKRMGSAVFVINDSAYVFGGAKNGSAVYDFYKYDATNDAWITLRETANTSDESYDDSYSMNRVRTCSFVINGKGYISCGESASGSVLGTTWEYNPATDLWTEKSDFEKTARTAAVGFSIDNHGYLLTGHSSSSYFDDVYEFYPNDELDTDD
jgi:N-acetylneuraminic acid mutarotase